MANKIMAPMWDKMQVFCKHIADHQVRLILKFDKILNDDVLRDAIAITLTNNPIAYATYTEEKRDSYWLLPELDIEKVYFYHECRETESITQETILKQLNTLEGPQLTISLIRSRTDILILNCNHPVTDASGVKEFAYQLAKNYCNISQNITTQEKEYLPSRSLRALSSGLSGKKRLAIVKTMLSNKKTAPTFQISVDPGNLQNPAFKTFTIEPKEFKQINSFAKKHLATINDIILAIYYFTLKKILNNSNKTNRIQYTSDLRKYLEVENYDVLSNFSAIHNIDIDNEKEDFIEILKEITTITKTRKHFTYDFADFPLLAFIFKLIPYKKLKKIFHAEFDKIKNRKVNAPPSLTNMGIIDKIKLDFDKTTPIQATMLGGINHPNLLQLGISTYMNHLTLSIGSYYYGNNDVFVSNFIKELKKTIGEEILRDTMINQVDLSLSTSFH